MNLKKLPDLIEELFNISELKDICFQLDIEFENLPGETTRSDKARELVDYCQRHGRLSKLLQLCQKLRPDIQWSSPDFSEQVKSNFITHLNSLDFPELPEAYIPHRYILQNYRFIGRDVELQKMTQWLNSSTKPPILIIVAHGGAGKSALAWHFFNEIAPKISQSLDGQIWWSFYEPNSQGDEFISRALAYIIKRPYNELAGLSQEEKQNRLLQILKQRPFLIVLDGLERIMEGYSESDKSKAADTHSNDDKNHTLSRVTNRSFINFLQQLSHTKSASRLLITSRSYPSDLRDKYTEERTVPTLFLPGLDDSDALELWNEIGLAGENQILLRLFHTFENHAVILMLLAGTIRRYRRAPGNFEQWVQDHPGFNPYKQKNIQTNLTHILELAIRGLDASQVHILKIIAGLYIPTSYDLLLSLFADENKLFDYGDTLDTALKDLEERGLVGWDKVTNRYEIHPIVRGFVWNRLNKVDRRAVYQKLFSQFRKLSPPEVTIRRESKFRESLQWFEGNSQVLKVVGPPASGKTTFLNQLRKEFEQLPNVITSHINAVDLCVDGCGTINIENAQRWRETFITDLNQRYSRIGTRGPDINESLKDISTFHDIFQTYWPKHKVCLFVDNGDSLSSNGWRFFESIILEPFLYYQNARLILALRDHKRPRSRIIIQKKIQQISLEQFSPNQGYNQLSELLKNTSNFPFTIDQIMGILPNYNWSHPGLNVILFILLSDFDIDEVRFSPQTYLEDVLGSLGYLPNQNSNQIINWLLSIVELNDLWSIQDLGKKFHILEAEAWQRVQIMRSHMLITNVKDRFKITEGICEFVRAVKAIENG